MTVHYFVSKGKEKIVMSQFFPDGLPQVPPGFVAAWKRDFITIYVPAGA